MKSVLGFMCTLLIFQLSYCNPVLKNELELDQPRSQNFEDVTQAETNPDSRNQKSLESEKAVDAVLAVRLEHDIGSELVSEGETNPRDRVSNENQEREDTDQHLQSRGTNCCIPIPVVFRHHHERHHFYLHQPEGTVPPPSRKLSSSSSFPSFRGSKTKRSTSTRRGKPRRNSRSSRGGGNDNPQPGYDYPQPGYEYPPPGQGYPPPGQGYPPPGQGYPPNGYAQDYASINHHRGYVATDAILSGIDALKKHPPCDRDGNRNKKNIKLLKKELLKKFGRVGFWNVLVPFVNDAHYYPLPPPPPERVTILTGGEEKKYMESVIKEEDKKKKS